MAEIETLGEAFFAKWGIRLRCGRIGHRGTGKVVMCRYSVALDVETLVCTHGRSFPLSKLASKMMCPNCGERRIYLTFDVPGSPGPVFVPQSGKP
jgi:hypothetical protein